MTLFYKMLDQDILYSDICLKNWWCFKLTDAKFKSIKKYWPIPMRRTPTKFETQKYLKTGTLYLTLHVFVKISRVMVFFILQSSRGPEVFCKKRALKNFTKFIGKHLYQSLFFNKVEGLRPATLLKETLARCLLMNFVKLSRTPFFIEHL